MKVIALLICLSVSFTAFAEDKISGYITGGLFVINTNDKLMVDKDGKNSDFDTLTKIGAMISGEINYAANDRTTVHFGAPRNEIIPKIELGVTTKFLNGSEADLSFLVAPFDKEWENPYTAKRHSTSVNSYGLKYEMKKIAGTGLFVEASAIARDVKKDKAEDQYSSLGRDGYDYELKSGYTFQKGRSFTSLFGKYAKGDRDGKAESFDQYGCGLRVVTMTQRGDLMIFLLSADRVNFDAANPYFGETRNETDYSAMMLYTLNNPFGFKDKFINFAGGYTGKESNTEFFDSDTYFAAIGAGLNF